MPTEPEDPTPHFEHLTPHQRLAERSREFADDDGSAPAGIRERLEAAASGVRESYLDAVAALCASRVLLAIMASDEDLGSAGQPEMAAVLLQRPTADGGTDRALPVFTGIDSLQSWQPTARPIPATLDLAAEAAINAQATTLVVDLTGPSTLIIEQPVLGELAQGRRLVKVDDGGYGWLHPRAPTERTQCP